MAIASTKSLRWVRLVVPTSISLAPARLMMSGTRKAPPISISSPRETMTCFFCARVLSRRNTAAALLFTTVAASAPVSSQSRSLTTLSRSPRPPDSMSYSSAQGLRAAAIRACTASSGKVARPRLVCSTVPVRLNTGRNFGCIFAVTPEPTSLINAAISAVSSGSGAPAITAVRVSARTSRTMPVTTARPWASTSEASVAVDSRRSTEGSWESGFMISPGPGRNEMKIF